MTAPDLLRQRDDLLAVLQGMVEATECVLPLAESWADGKSRSHVDHEAIRDAEAALSAARTVIAAVLETGGEHG